MRSFRNIPAGRTSNTTIMMAKITVFDASGKNNLGQSLDDAEREAGEDRSHDGAHAADHDYGEHDNNEVRPHLRRDIVESAPPSRRQAPASPTPKP